VVVDETEELFDAIETLSACARRPCAPRLAVLTVSGGPSVVAADTAERIGLGVPALDASTRDALRALLPAFAAVGNPVDLTPQVEPARIAAAVRIVLDHADIAGAVAVNVGLDIPAFADAIVAASRATDKPVVAFTADAPDVTARFRAGGVPVLAGPERAVRAWRALWSARPRPDRPAPPLRGLDAAVAAMLERAPAGPLPYRAARSALEAVGVRFCREAIVATAEAAVRAADGLGYPVVVKADAERLSHRTEVGGVRLDVGDADAVRAACRELRAAAGAERFVVQERVGPGVELLVGARRDLAFGPVVAVGTGGILTEVVRDVAVCLAPVDADEAGEMLAEGARGRLLAGPRGLPRGEAAPIVETMRAVGNLLLAAPRVREIDLNPLIVAGAAALAVDALLIIG
jgi:acyl-CoA synthetase (NDP forming)